MKKEKYEIVTEYLECTATANASTANLGPGYDVFGLGLDVLHDTISIKIERKTTADKNNIKIIMNGDMGRSIPNDLEFNSAGRVAKKIISDYNLYNYDCLIEIRKNIPPGYGMGSSAASAVATAVSLNALFGLNIEDTKVLDYSAEGELASAGVKHFDNVAGSLFGNFVIVKTRPKLEFIRIDSPNNLSMIICVPLIQVPKMKTEFSRKVIPQQVPLENMVHNVANACSVVAGFYLKDIEMICNGINDSVIEPARKKLIPGYEKIKERSLDVGAMAFTISGAGPSTIAFSDSSKKGLRISEVMEEEYDKINIKSKTYISKSGNGSKIVSLK